MTAIREYYLKEQQRFFESANVVDPRVIEQFQKDMAEDYKKYIIEDRQRRAKTAKLSQEIFIV